MLDIDLPGFERMTLFLAQVPYSLHSSFQELTSFVAALRPRQLIPTVSGAVDPDLPTDTCALFADLLAPDSRQRLAFPHTQRWVHFMMLLQRKSTSNKMEIQR